MSHLINGHITNFNKEVEHIKKIWNTYVYMYVCNFDIKICITEMKNTEGFNNRMDETEEM